MSDPDLHLRKFQKELSAGTVSLALLAVLGEASEPMYGYQIAKRLERLEGVLAGKQSALYPVLRGMEGGGLLDSHVEPSVSGPPRRYYRITPAGRDVLARWSAAWRGTRDSVDAVLGPLAATTPAIHTDIAHDPGITE
jgi:PadR family transcriptional regulator PadR